MVVTISVANIATFVIKKFPKKVSTLDMMVNQQSPNPYQNLVALAIGFDP
jgi:hypothetical protein